MELCRFYRSSAQTVLPPNRNLRGGRLSGSFDNQIKYLERDASETKVKAQQGRGLKRAKEEELMDLRNNFNGVKVFPLALQLRYPRDSPQLFHYV